MESDERLLLSNVEPHISFRLDSIERGEEKSTPFSVSYPRVKCHRFFQANGSTTLLSAKCITFRGRFNAEFLSKCKVFNRLRWEIRFREFYGPERIDSSPLLLGTAYIKP